MLGYSGPGKDYWLCIWSRRSQRAWDSISDPEIPFLVSDFEFQCAAGLERITGGVFLVRVQRAWHSKSDPENPSLGLDFES